MTMLPFSVLLCTLAVCFRESSAFSGTKMTRTRLVPSGDSAAAVSSGTGVGFKASRFPQVSRLYMAKSSSDLRKAIWTARKASSNDTDASGLHNTAAMNSTATAAMNSTSTAVKNAQAKAEKNGSTSSKTPHPPKYPPPAYGKDLRVDYNVLVEETATKESNINSLQEQIQELQKQLVRKEQALKKGGDEWSTEKTSLISKIAEFTNMLSKQDETDEEDEYQKERMEREVNLLQGQLSAIQNQLRQEQMAAEQVKQRLGEVEDKMEFQQMEFQKEKETLQEAVEEKKKKLASIQSQWNQDKDRFTTENTQIEQELRQELDRLKEAQAEWKQNQEDFQREQEPLREQLAAQTSSLQRMQIDLSSERVKFKKEAAELREAILQEQTKVRQIERTLEDEKTRFQQAQSELEKRIRDEQEKVVDLSNRLEAEKERFGNEKSRLEERIDSEQQRLTAIEEKLALEQLSFSEERVQLEDRIAEEVRVRQLKKRQMNERYAAIRDELTNLWQGAKREAREEKTALMAKYDKDIGALSGTIAELEVDLYSSRKSGDELQSLLKDVTKQKERAVQDTQATERRYTLMLAVRNQEIVALKSNLQELRKSAQENEEKLAKYETSFREVMKLSVQVTGMKLKRTRTRVSGWIRRKRNFERDVDE